MAAGDILSAGLPSALLPPSSDSLKNLSEANLGRREVFSSPDPPHIEKNNQTHGEKPVEHLLPHRRRSRCPSGVDRELHAVLARKDHRAADHLPGE